LLITIAHLAHYNQRVQNHIVHKFLTGEPPLKSAVEYEHAENARLANPYDVNSAQKNVQKTVTTSLLLDEGAPGFFDRIKYVLQQPRA